MKTVEIADNKNNIVKKHNDIIEAKGKLSETAQKMLAMLIAMVQVDDSEFQEYALNIQDYLQRINSDSANVDFLKNKALELMKNPFYIINEDGKKEYFNWCSKVAPYKLEGYIVFTIHKDLKPYLLNLKRHFTTYNIVNVMKLKGDYTLRLYEYLLMEWNEFRHNYKKRHNRTPSSYTTEIEIDWLREYFGISKGYRYNDIKRQIIEKAQKQFKEKTDIQFDYEEQKIGKRVNSLKITIKSNEKGSNDYLVNLHSFIRYVRENYVNRDIWQGQGLILSVSEDGRIYDKKTLREYTKEKSQKVWETWYQLAKENKLEILK